MLSSFPYAPWEVVLLSPTYNVSYADITREIDVQTAETVPTPIPEVEAAGPPCHRCGGDHVTAACVEYPMPRLAVQPSSLWLEVSSLDFIGRKVCDDLHACATGGLVLPLALRISNTETSDSRGYHWFTVAHSIEPE